jgi:GGDEF domain-containing protein
LRTYFSELDVESRRLAFFLDRITGLLNDRGFRALPRDPARPWLASWELEGGKFFNDFHGHDAYDGALRVMAQVLVRRGVHDGAKLGGGLFAWVSGPEQAESIAAIGR